jgi:hypothetical protein
MDWLLLVHASYCTFHIMHCIKWLLAHTCSYTLDPTEPEVEESTEPAPTEVTANAKLTEGKHRCIPPIFLDFCFKSVFMLQLACALSL